MGPIYITISEAMDLMDLPSDTEEQAVRTELCIVVTSWH